MKLKLFYILLISLLIFSCDCGSRTEYKCKIEGTEGLKVRRYFNITHLNPRIVTIPYVTDITSSKGGDFYIGVEKTTEDGKVKIKVVRIDYYFIFIEDESTIEESETDEPFGECHVYVFNL